MSAPRQAIQGALAGAPAEAEVQALRQTALQGMALLLGTVGLLVIPSAILPSNLRLLLMISAAAVVGIAALARYGSHHLAAWCLIVVVQAGTFLGASIDPTAYLLASPWFVLPPLIASLLFRARAVVGVLLISGVGLIAAWATNHVHGLSITALIAHLALMVTCASASLLLSVAVREVTQGTRRQSEGLATALNSLDAGFVLTDRSGTILEASEGALQLIAAQPADVQGEQLSRFCPTTGGAMAQHVAVLRLDGSSFPARVQSVPVARSDQLRLWVIQDLSLAQRRLDAANHALAVARRAQEARARLFRMMDHEIRNPLNVIAGYAQVLRSSPKASEPLRESLDAILASVSRLAEVADEAGLLAESDMGIEAVGATCTLADPLQSATARAGAVGRIDLLVRQDPGALQAHPTLLEDLLYRLISHLIAAGARPTVEVDCAGGLALVSVLGPAGTISLDDAAGQGRVRGLDGRPEEAALGLRLLVAEARAASLGSDLTVIRRPDGRVGFEFQVLRASDDPS